MKDKAGSDQPLILWVGDDVADGAAGGEVLAGAGFQLEKAADGRSGLEAFKKYRPDVVLMEAKLPEMDGFETCVAIRSLPGGEATPLLMMMDPDDAEAMDKAFQAGATDFATKPINYLRLAHRLRHVLRLHGSMEELKTSQKRLADAQRIARIGHWEWEVDSETVSASPRLREIFSFPPDTEVTYGALLSRVHPGDREMVVKALENTIHEGKPCRIEHRIVPPSGQEYTIYQEAEIAVEELKGTIRLVGTAQDITKRKKAEQKILQLAYYDNLTGLPNRTFFKEHLDYLLKIAKRYDRRIAILSFDLDLFKRINDTWGHDAGDRMLSEVGQRVTACLRRSDFIARKLPPGYENVMATGGDAVARLGGDEFVILLSEIREDADATVVGQRVMETLSEEPFVFDGEEVHVTSSIGISLYPIHGENAEELLKKADLALYSAKEKGRNSQVFYSNESNAEALELLTLGKDLNRAIEHEEFVLYYQPRVNAKSGEITGAEALIRWEHPELGTLLPQKFLPLVEESGLAPQLGRWAVGTVCRQIKTWQVLDLPSLRVSVNVSRAQFRRDSLTTLITELLKENGLTPQSLEVEVGEALLLEDEDADRQSLKDLREMGLHISLDNFGTGHSILRFLKRYPIDSLKLDPSLIQDAGTDSDGSAIVSAIIALAEELQLGVIANGVETQEQVAFLRERGCDVIQGYFFSKPLAGDEFAKWLQAHGRVSTTRFPGRPVSSSAASSD